MPVPKKKLSRKQQNDFRKDYLKGMSWRELGRKYSLISQETVGRYIKSMGLTRN